MNEDYIFIKGSDLNGLKTLLNTSVDDDYLEIFYQKSNHMNYQGDYIKTDTPIRVDIGLAIKIWEAVELSDIKKIMIKERKAEINVTKMLKSE